uniref:Uncharacterized protein n=1 Tax=Timema genevievae TaxID=629358 RepID=A0A7R9JTE7_TIMGE|nr:unnamed protein product [Timema genevievae]
MRGTNDSQAVVRELLNLELFISSLLSPLIPHPSYLRSSLIPPISAHHSYLLSPHITHPSYLRTPLIPPISTHHSSLLSPHITHPSYLHTSLIPPISTHHSSLLSPHIPHPSYLRTPLIPPISAHHSSLLFPLITHPSYLRSSLIPPISTHYSSLLSPHTTHPSYLHTSLIPPISAHHSSLLSSHTTHPSYFRSSLIPPISAHPSSLLSPHITHPSYLHTLLIPPISTHHSSLLSPHITHPSYLHTPLIPPTSLRSLVNQEENFKKQLAELNDQLTASDTERNKLLYQMEELQRDVIVKNSGVDRRGGVGDLGRINHPPVRARRVLREERLGDISLARGRTAVYMAGVVPFLAYPVSTVILHTCKEGGAILPAIPYPTCFRRPCSILRQLGDGPTKPPLKLLAGYGLGHRLRTSRRQKGPRASVVAESDRRLGSFLWRMTPLCRGLQAELTAAHKDSELVRKRMNRLEEDLNEFKQKNMELAEELVRKAEELQSDGSNEKRVAELESSLEEVQGKVKRLETELQSLQKDRDSLQKEREDMLAEREEEMKIVQEALEESQEEKMAIQARFEKDFERLRTVNTDREQQLLDDFEWKLREVEQVCKRRLEEKDKVTEERIREMKRAIEGKVKVAEKQLQEAEQLKSYEAEVTQLRGLTQEQQRSLRVATRQTEQLQVSEKMLKEEISRLESSLNKEKAHYSAMQTIHDRRMAELEKKLQARLDQQKSELTAFWEDRVRKECSRFKVELDLLHSEEKKLAVEAVRSQKEQELKTAKLDWERRMQDSHKEARTNFFSSFT